jgi:hypothetical protein
MKKGDTKEIKIDFPSDYADETLAGKEVIYKVTVQNVRREGELTDEWVAKNTDYTTVDDYRESIRSELEKNAKESAQEVLKNTAWSTVLENSEVKEENATEEKKPAFDDQALQTVLDEWLKTIPSSSRAAVVLMDENGGELASVSSQEAFFTASIYKLYVAYEGYRMVDAGTYDSATSYLNGKTLGECLDLMIRESNSPCAEKMWNGIGKDVLDTKMKEYGLKKHLYGGLEHYGGRRSYNAGTDSTR